MNDFIKKYYPYFPIFGLVSYVIVFVLATYQYPGGSTNIPYSEGHSYFHNFLCDLTLPVAFNGLENPAMELAIFGHLLLSFAMISFFYILPEIFDSRNLNTRLIRFMGMSTIFVFVLMFTNLHDYIVTATGILGSLALIPFFIELHKSEMNGLKFLAYACFFMSLIVFISFETKIGFYFLPLLQKITFILDAWWVIWVSLIVAKKNTPFTLGKS